MRRAIVFVVVASFVLGAFSAAVQAATKDRGKSAAALPSDSAYELKQLQMPPIKPPSCNANGPADRYIACLDRYLTKLSKNLNRALADINNLYECFFAVPVSQYGENPNGGTFGYVWSGDNLATVFLTTSLDFTIDPTIEPFEYFALIDKACVEPA